MPPQRALSPWILFLETDWQKAVSWRDRHDPEGPSSPTLGRITGWEDPGFSGGEGFQIDSDSV